MVMIEASRSFENEYIKAIGGQVDRILASHGRDSESSNYLLIDLPTQLLSKGTLYKDLMIDNAAFPIPADSQATMSLTVARDEAVGSVFAVGLRVFSDSRNAPWVLAVGVDSLGNSHYQRGLMEDRPVEAEGLREIVRILRYEEHLTELRNMLSDYSPEDVAKAEHALLGVEVHLGHLVRRSGEHILTHAIEPARILMQAGITDIDMIVAAIGHDILEDSRFWRQKKVSEERGRDKTIKIYEPVGPWLGDKADLLADEVGPVAAGIIVGVTRLKPDGEEIFTPEHADYVYLDNVSLDIKRVLIKMADRTHNLETLDAMPAGKQIDTIIETITYWTMFEKATQGTRYQKAAEYMLNRQWKVIEPRTKKYNIPLRSHPRWVEQEPVQT